MHKAQGVAIEFNEGVTWSSNRLMASQHSEIGYAFNDSIASLSVVLSHHV